MGLARLAGAGVLDPKGPVASAEHLIFLNATFIIMLAVIV